MLVRAGSFFPFNAASVVCIAFSAFIAVASGIFVYPIGQGSFSDGTPLKISGTCNFMLVL